jgi:hypothetical protein
MVSRGIHAPLRTPAALIKIEHMPGAALSFSAVPINMPRNMHIINVGKDERNNNTADPNEKNEVDVIKLTIQPVTIHKTVCAIPIIRHGRA